MDNKLVRHSGIVKEISPEKITVEILNKSMCAACHAKSMCSMSDMEVKIITVYPPFPARFETGEEVEVIMKRTLGFRAVWISYIIPLAILLILLVSLRSLNLNDLQAGLLSILSVGVYYGVIYLFRDRIAKKFTFTIAKI